MERFCKYEVVTSKVATLSVRAVGTGTKRAHGPGVKVRKSVKNPDHFRRDEQSIDTKSGERSGDEGYEKLSKWVEG